MSDRVRTILVVSALMFAAVALVVSLRSSPAPSLDADSVKAVEEARAAYYDEHARFVDALRLLQNLGMAVEQVLTPEQMENAAVAEAIEKAKDRIKGWTE